MTMKKKAKAAVFKTEHDTDAKPKGSNSSTRINIRLIEVSPDTVLADLDRLLSYYELFAVIEAKCSISGEDEAFEQLLVYTQQVYALQHDRWFTWDVVVCGSNVRVCLLGPNEAIWGLDLTIDYFKDIECWKIKCLMEGGKDSPSYIYSDRVIMDADHLFGWHTQCFLGLLDMLPEGSELKHDIVIKDS
ncbi:hypothetical protein EV182_001214 [Spiromyces aspiralis]|uniref:Uncharacterized protein n=1 Tax=Spiromyces aspiralis TaxID=68401 RepID=A0ACC1HJQ1_9FUNG|nr:hypothetical protein EV182_001214 [Spiromyces aspiralis]